MALRIGYFHDVDNNDIYQIHPCAFDSALRITYPDCPYPGTKAEKFLALLNTAQINFTMVRLKTPDFSDYLRIGQIDCNVNEWWTIPSPNESNPFIFTNPLNIKSTYSALFSINREQSDTHEMFKSLFIFSPLIWMFMVISYVSYKSTLYIVRRRKICASCKWPVHLMLDFLAGIVLALYGNYILAGLLVKHETPVFTDFDGMIEALESQKIRLAAPSYDFAELNDLFAGQNLSESALRLNATFADNEPLIVLELWDDMTLLKSLNVFRILPTFLAEWYGNTECAFYTVLLPELGAINKGIAFRRGVDDGIVERLNEAMFKAYEVFRVIDHRYEQLAIVANDSYMSCIDLENGGKSTITLDSLQMLFCVWSAAYVIALIIFFMELLSKVRITSSVEITY